MRHSVQTAGFHPPGVGLPRWCGAGVQPDGPLDPEDGPLVAPGAADQDLASDGFFWWEQERWFGSGGKGSQVGRVDAENPERVSAACILVYFAPVVDANRRWGADVPRPILGVSQCSALQRGEHSDFWKLEQEGLPGDERALLLQRGGEFRTGLLSRMMIIDSPIASRCRKARPTCFGPAHAMSRTFSIRSGPLGSLKEDTK